jgi:predicted RNase H-like HicB family nuclease
MRKQEQMISLLLLNQRFGFEWCLIFIINRRPAMTRTFTALIHKEDEWYVADYSEVGTVSQGRTVEEAIANLKEATELYLEEFPLPETNHPLLTTFEVATYA